MQAVQYDRPEEAYTQELSAAILALTSLLDGDELLSELLGQAAVLMPAQAHALYLPNEGGRQLQLAAMLPDSAPSSLIPERLPVAGSLAGCAFQSGQPTSYLDLPTAEPAWPDLHAFHVPLMLGGRCLGVLSLAQPATWPTSAEAQLLSSYARHAAPLLRRWHLETRLQQQKALLETVHQRLAKVDRLKSDLISTVTHELRTPLASVIGYADMLLREADGDWKPDHVQYLHGIRDSARRQLNTVNDLVYMSQIESGRLRLDLQPVNVREVAMRAATTLRPVIMNKSQALTLDWPERIPLVRGDPDRLYQVLVNLLTNASKFTPPGGQLWVSGAAGTEGELTVHVRDTGVGIPPHERALIFEPFTRGSDEATRQQPGLGLGLSIVRHLVEMHGGQVWVESEVGQGSTFSFTVPLYFRDWVEASHHALILWRDGDVGAWNPDLIEWLAGRLQAGERWGCILRADRAAGLQVALTQHGLVAPQLVVEGRLVLMRERNLFLEEQYVDLDRLTEVVRNFLLEATREGYPGAGMGIDMAWVFHGERRLSRILEQETRLAELLHEFQGPFGLWCGYQVDLLPEPILDALRTRHSPILE